jgi:antitoxin MazE
VAKWGNSLGLRLPKSVAVEARINDGDLVDVAVEDGVIVIRPAGRRYSLDELVGAISARNRHSETDWGKPVGREVW